MVSFICDECQATLKKAKVASHSWQCSSHRFSCIDCGDSFDPRTAAAHLSCISEAEKHQGKLYRGPKSAAQQRQPSRSHSATPPHAPSTTVTRSSPTPSHTATATAAATASPTASASAAATKVPSAVNDDGGRSTTAQHRKRSRAEPQRVGEEEGEEEEEARAVHGEEAKEAEQRTETPVTVAAALTAALDEAVPTQLLKPPPPPMRHSDGYQRTRSRCACGSRHCATRRRLTSTPCVRFLSLCAVAFVVVVEGASEGGCRSLSVGGEGGGGRAVVGADPAAQSHAIRSTLQAQKDSRGCRCVSA